LFCHCLDPLFLPIVQKILEFAQKRVKRMDAQKTINMSVTGKAAKASGTAPATSVFADPNRMSQSETGDGL
jgi:hypothetical protein